MRAMLSASTLTGDDVVNPAGEKLGRLEDIVIDPAAGSVGYAVLGRGGVMGMGKKLFAIPWRLVAVDGGNEQLVVDLDEEFLDASPGFDPDEWPDLDDVWVADIDRHYGVDR